ncbi:hypothetical protein BGZ88_008840 [Linnemannia elongata]|nr:hypothetical protein BGZ88_008840 [Linnemannia elongata]
MTVKGWLNNCNSTATSAFKKNNKRHQPQQHPTITTITAPLPPFSTPLPPYSHTVSPSLPSSTSSSASCNISSPFSPLASTAPSTLSSFQINKKSPLRHTVMQQPQQQPHQQHHDSTSPKSPRPYTLNVLPTTTSSPNSSPSSASRASLSPPPSRAPINNNLFTALTMNPHKSVPRPPTEFHIRPSTPPPPPSSSYNKNSTATYSNSSSFCNLDKALPAPPKRVTRTKTTTAAALQKFKGLKTRLRTHSFSSSTFSFPTPSTSPSSPQQSSVLSLVTSSHKNPSSSSTVSTTPESVAQEYARTIKSLWKMIEDEEQAYRLVEASHSLSGSIPTIADISPLGTGGVTNRPTYAGAGSRRPSLPLLMTVPPIQEEEETSPSTTATLPTRSPFSPRPSSGPRRRHHHHHQAVSLAILNTTPLHTKPTTTTTTLVCSPTNEMDHTVADLELSPVGFSDASEEEYSSENDSEAEEERAVVHVAQKVSVYRGRSFCWSQPA